MKIVYNKGASFFRHQVKIWLNNEGIYRYDVINVTENLFTRENSCLLDNVRLLEDRMVIFRLYCSPWEKEFYKKIWENTQN